MVPTFTTCNDRLLVLLPDGRRGMLRIEDAERLQGLPAGWTAPCYPIATPGVNAPRGIRAGNGAEGETQGARRWDLLGNAVTVPVGRWLGERLASPYAYKYHGVGVGDRRMDDLLAQTTAGTAGAQQEGGRSDLRTSPNIWSFVVADDLQEAVLFPYLVKERQQPQEDGAVLGAAEAAEGHQQLEGTGSLEGGSVQGEGAEADVQGEARAAAAEVALSTATATAEEAGINAEETNLNNIIGTVNGTTDGTEVLGVNGSPNKTSLLQQLERTPNPSPTEPTPQEMFQAAVLDRIQRGNVSAGGRMQLPWDKQSWPRCAWWVRGLGAFAVHGMSDAPVLTPFQPLGEFLEELGRPPTDEECASYVNRLQERGWQVAPTLLGRLGCAPGGSTEEIAEICRLPGLVSDADMVGDIVWTHDAVSGIYWPAEILDPLSPVPGKALPALAVNHLTPDQRRASLPCTDGSYDPLQESAANRRVLALFLPMPSQGAPAEWKVR